MRHSIVVAVVGIAFAIPGVARTQAAKATDSVVVHVSNTDLRSAVQMIQAYLDKPVIFSGSTAGPQVSLETPHPVPRSEIPMLLRGLLDSQGYELVDDSATRTYRARPKEVIRSPNIVQQQMGAAGPAAADATRRQTTAPELFVLPLKHARAADVATTINTLFGRAAPQQSGMGGSRAPTLADELRGNQIPPLDATPLPQSVPGTAGHAATITGELTIVADPHANSLLIRANRADFELIRAAVEQIDVRPAQVLIEVLIVEARRDRNFSLGIEASIDQHHIPGTENTTIGGTFTPANAGLADFTLKVMGVGGLDLDATISAAASRGDVRIVSRPIVLTANDEQAEVNVGSQRPFVQVSRSLPTDAGVRDQVVEYRDVGTKLSVRPTISVDGIVALSVTQEVSSATTETAFNAPVISTRSVKTDLLVRDSQTVVLGGLSDKERDVQVSGIPILSSIPLIGGLFGSHTRSGNETELFIFLTPRVIRNDADMQRLTDPMRNRANKVMP
ncbi:MAG TPA: secretin N-terminal domain-containing protein [Gemmatimonadaceae bacterium]|nr:secretin N-terminal domain-containing protein [Gemmatimonadaceae bacterium]